MIVDSLLIEVGLDPTKLTAGARKAVNDLRTFEQEAHRRALDVESSARRTGDAISGIRTQSLEMFGAIAGGTALVSFAANAIHAGAAAGRLSRNINVSVDTITRFQSLASTFGGSAEGMAQSFVQVSDALEGWKIGDVKSVIADYRALGSAGGTIIDINKGVEQTFLDIAKNLRVLHDQDPALAGYWQRRLGIDPGLFDAMIQKGDNFTQLLEKMRGLTDAEAEAAGRLERRWNSFVNTATKTGQGAVLDLVDSKSKFNPLSNGSDAKDIQMIAGWIDSMFGTHLSASTGAAISTSDLAGASNATGAFANNVEKEAFIRAEAKKRGIDPDVAMRVSRSEGFNNFQSTVTTRDGSREKSWGAFQLYTGGGLGNEFQKATGLDPSNPANERATIEFALEHAHKKGWGAFHGAANTGISNFQGIGGGSSSTATTTVGTVNIYAGSSADGRKLGEDFKSTLERQSLAAQANSGQS